MSAPLRTPPIPIPWRMKWHWFRTQGLPVVVLAGTALAIAGLWPQREPAVTAALDRPTVVVAPTLDDLATNLITSKSILPTGSCPR